MPLQLCWQLEAAADLAVMTWRAEAGIDSMPLQLCWQLEAAADLAVMT